MPFGTPIGGRDTTYGSLKVYVTSKNRIKWKAPNKADSYYFSVNVNDNSKDSIPVEAGFSVNVVQ